MSNDRLFDISANYSDTDEEVIDIFEDNENNENIIDKCFQELKIVLPPINKSIIDLEEASRELDKLLEGCMPINNDELTCNKCFKSFSAKYQLEEHIFLHDNETENKVCICKRCKLIFNSDEEYLSHNYHCSGTLSNTDLPTDEQGKHICPICNKKYSNQFYLGEHFIDGHNDYNELLVLDEKSMLEELNGFPGFDILEKINMIQYITLNKLDHCHICFFDYDNDDNNSDCRKPLLLNCCGRSICYSCLMHQLSINNNVICPFCLKDHTRNDLDYIVEIIEIEKTEREKWIPWWENHLDIFEK